MLLFRDWLRTNAADRDVYASIKRELAARDWKYAQQYADAKTARSTRDPLSCGSGEAGGGGVKVHIISDMEGVAGIVKWEQTTGGDPMYEEGRRLYTEEINAAVRGAKAAGATEIVVMDCHGAGKGWSFNSLIPDLLDPACEFVVQQEWTEYTEFLEQGCDAALFVGMHARAGTRDGVMNHTVSGQSWQNLSFNGTLVGETGINAALCGNWSCPVLLVTGDEAVCREGRELLGDGLETVAVKRGLGAFSARQLPAQRARELIEKGAKAALGDLSAVEPYDPGSPCTIEVEFTRTASLDEYTRKPPSSSRANARSPRRPTPGGRLGSNSFWSSGARGRARRSRLAAARCAAAAADGGGSRALPRRHRRRRRVSRGRSVHRRC